MTKQVENPSYAMLCKYVKAVRIYYSGYATLADLLTNDGVTETIDWCDKRQRESFLPMMNGYTMIYDERPKKDWSEYHAAQ